MPMRVFEVMAVVVLVTFPFGFYRAYTRKLSVRWFLAIHLPVPLVFLARFEAHLPYTFIPFTCFAFFVGQYAGGKAGQWWIARHRPVTVEQASAQATVGDARQPGQVGEGPPD
jgi:hypothetical protein